MPGKLLIYGNDPMLLTTRRLILEKVGYEVATVATFSDAMRILLNQQLDLLILCQSLNEEERRGILELAHAIKPELKCAVLQFLARHERIANEETLEGLLGPTTLIASIRRMLQSGLADSVDHAAEAN